MQKAASFLLGEHDFSAFRAAECQAKSPVKRCANACAVGDYVLFDFEATAFLHHMVRNMVGSSSIGNGKHPPEWIDELLAERDRSGSPTFAPDGLYLRCQLRSALNPPAQPAPVFEEFIGSEDAYANQDLRHHLVADGLAAAAGADAIGLAFYPKARVMHAGRAAEIAPRCPLRYRRRTVRQCDTGIRQQTLAQVPVGLLQFHGDEDETTAASSERPFLKAARMGRARFGTIRGFVSVGPGHSARRLRSKAAGGAGHTFDWR